MKLNGVEYNGENNGTTFKKKGNVFIDISHLKDDHKISDKPALPSGYRYKKKEAMHVDQNRRAMRLIKVIVAIIVVFYILLIMLSIII